MQTATDCPSSDQLNRLLREVLAESEQAAIAQHLESCAACQTALEQLAADSGVWRDAAQRLVEPAVLDAALQRVMDAQKNGVSDGATQTEAALGHDVELDFLEPSDNPRHLGRLGGYEITDVIGYGGMGVVLKGHDAHLNRFVAIKVLMPELASNANARKRFRREGRAAAAVNHVHVVTIHAVDEINGTPLLVMEFIAGKSLEQRLAESEPLQVSDIVRIGMQTAAGLAAAHAQGLVHRDIKPANILLENSVERVKISDFGLARAVDDVRITRPGVVTGTPEYMSPEQARGEAVDHRADLFSLGCVMYAMCAGRSPFGADSTPAVIHRVCSETPRPIGEVNPEVPGWLNAVIDKLLAKDPEERFQSAAEVARLLERYLAHLQQPSAVPEPPRPSMVRPRMGRTRRTLELLRMPAIVAVLLIAGITLTDAAGLTEVASTVIRVVRGDGILEVRVEDPDVSVSIDGDEVVVTGAGVHEIRVTPGKHEIQYARNGEPIQQQLVSIERGDRKVLEITLEPVAKALEAAAEPAAVIERDGELQHQLVWTQFLLSEVMSISPDGRYVAYFDLYSSDLSVHDLVTGEDRQLTTATGEDGKFSTSDAVFSPDGQWLACNWSNDRHQSSLRIARIDGTDSREILPQEEGRRIDPRGWTPDGREILCVFKHADSAQIAFVTVGDGAIRVVKSLNKSLESYPIVALAPDGRYIAYEIPAGDGDGENDQSSVYVLSADGRREESVPGADDVRLLNWTPDGERLLVRMNHSGVDRVWVIGLENGRPSDRPQHVREGVAGNLLTAGQFTPDGSFYYVRGAAPEMDELWVVRNFLPAYQPRQRVVWSAPGLGDMFSVARDESRLAFRDADTGDLAVRSLNDGTVRRLSHNSVPWQNYPNIALLSPDGQFVACEWRSESGLKSDLRLFPIDGGEPRVLYVPDGQNVRMALPQDWSPDGQQLLVRFVVGAVNEHMTEIALIPINGDPPRILQSLPYRPGSNPGSNVRFSPDGRFIAYETLPDIESRQSDIALMPLGEGQEPIVLLGSDADEDILGWVPDGLLFLRRTRINERQTWLIRIDAAGRPQGEPRWVTTGAGYGEFAPDGTFYNVAGGGDIQDVWLASLDSDSGAVLEQPEKVSQRFPGHTCAAAWSPVTRSLAYYVDSPGWSIVIRSADETGNEREIPLSDLHGPPTGSLEGLLHWSPDAASLLFGYFEHTAFVYRLNLQNEELTIIEKGGGGMYPSLLGWSRDPSEPILCRAPTRAPEDDQPLTQQYLRLNLESGVASPIYRQPLEQINGHSVDGSVSRDGSQLAVLHRTADIRGGSLSLFTLPMAGGEPQVLYETTRDRSGRNAGRCLSWTPDGKYLVFSLQTTRRIAIGPQGTPLMELWRVRADGEGEPEPLGFAATGLWNLDIHPDGRHIAYTRQQRMYNLRATEHLLEDDP